MSTAMTIVATTTILATVMGLTVVTAIRTPPQRSGPHLQLRPH
jgi:hypothetical protein